jgi:hypothetical protein
MLERVARYDNIAFVDFVPRKAVGLVQNIFHMVMGVSKHITKVHVELSAYFVVRFRMGKSYPFRMILTGQFLWGFTVEFTVLWTGRREQNAGHKPRRWNFAKEYQQDSSKLPRTEITDSRADWVVFLFF